MERRGKPATNSLSIGLAAIKVIMSFLIFTTALFYRYVISLKV